MCVQIEQYADLLPEPMVDPVVKALTSSADVLSNESLLRTSLLGIESDALVGGITGYLVLLIGSQWLD